MSQLPDPKDPQDCVLPHQRWFAELKRRRVFRVVAVYGAMAFLVMEVADLVFPAIPLPAWTVSLVVWLAILGFPFAPHGFHLPPVRRFLGRGQRATKIRPPGLGTASAPVAEAPSGNAIAV